MKQSGPRQGTPTKTPRLPLAPDINLPHSRHPNLSTASAANLTPAMLLRAPRPDPARFMETLTGSGSDRLLGLFSARDPASAAGLELNEDDIFGSQSPSSPVAGYPNPDLSRREISGRNLGVLAALPDRNPNPCLMPKLSISCSSSAITIPPPAGKPKKEKEKMYYSSAPVSIPAVNLRSKGFDINGEGWDADDEETMTMPPHEILARRESRESSPMATTFSVLEGKGRTLKGRDLRRVRNAVFRTTGFED